LRVLEVIREAHPILHAEKHVPPWEEDVVYTTEEALHAQQKEFEDLVHGRMAANSAAISRAAAHGDLSENAEFTAALEERDRLVERAGRMQQDLAKVKVIRRSMAEGDHVTVGSRVVAKDLATGKAEELAFLGPWDAAPERGVYYYRTALGLAFMGKAVGDTVVMQTRSEERRWEIAEIRPAL
jgi:transcription elongation GreA/GreB family factor